MPRNPSGRSRGRTAAKAVGGGTMAVRPDVPAAPVPPPSRNANAQAVEPTSAVARIETTPSHRALALALYRVRLEKGLSLRALAQQLGYSAHSMFADLEKARRLPSEPLLRSYEERFGLPPRSLLDLRQQALIERAARIIAPPEAPAAVPPQPAAAPASRPQPAELRTPLLARLLRTARERVRGLCRPTKGTGGTR